MVRDNYLDLLKMADETTSLTGKEKPKIPCLVLSVDILSFFTIASCLTVIIASVVNFFDNDLQILDHIVGFYLLVICVPIMFIELQWFKVLKQSLISTRWTVRGFVYVFIGTLVLQNHPEDTFSNSSPSTVIVLLAAFTMFVSGTLYFVLGCLCVKGRYDTKLESYKQDIADYKVRNCSCC